jgi:hypothetical protein
LEYYAHRPTAVTVILPARIISLLKEHIQSGGMSKTDAQNIDELVSSSSFDYYIDAKNK